MTCVADNATFASATTAPPGLITTVSDSHAESKKVRNNESQVPVNELPPVMSVSFKPEQYIAFQLSKIAEQKGVYLYLEKGVYYITVYVDTRDLALNRRIFEQERNMMNFYKHQYKFDLSVLPLQGRQVAEMQPKGMKVL